MSQAVNKLDQRLHEAGILIKTGRLDEALTALMQIHKDYPKDDLTLFFIATTFYKADKLKETAEYAKKTLALNPNFKVLRSYIAEYESRERCAFHDAIKLLEEEIKLDPESRSAYKSLGAYHAWLGNIDKGIALTQKQVEVYSDNSDAHDNLLMLMVYSPNYTWEDIQNTADAYYNICLKKVPKIGFDFSLRAVEKEKLKIGFVSGDLKKHVVFYWIYELFQCLREKDLEIYCYANNIEDDFSELLKEDVDSWMNILFVNDTEVSKKIYEDEIDILIDLSGHTHNNRLEVFYQKPAPVQLTWLGWPAPTGLPEIDYTISDWSSVEEGEDYCREKIYRMPHVFAPISIHKAFNNSIPAKSVARDNGFITFGCFNTLKKVNRICLDAFIEILKKVEGSKLILKADLFKNELNKSMVVDYFIDSGINKERLIFEKSEDKSKYLDAYNRVDITLDPFPVGGATTTHDTIFMSTPLITLKGDPQRGRGSTSILNCIGHSELIANSTEEYIEKVVELAKDLDRLDNYKSMLREDYLKSKAIDVKTFADDFAEALRFMWSEQMTAGK